MNLYCFWSEPPCELDVPGGGKVEPFANGMGGIISKSKERRAELEDTKDTQSTIPPS